MRLGNLCNLRRGLIVFIKCLFLLSAAHSENLDALSQSLLVISDVDNTVQLEKGPGPIGLIGAFVNLVKLHDSFLGMSNVYRAMANRGAEVHYVTAAIDQHSDFPRQFLLCSGFPCEEIHTRRRLRQRTMESKLEDIRKILRNHPTRSVILVGDNTSKDTLVYKQIKQEFEDRIQLVYIHQIFDAPHGRNLEEGQISFRTSAELALSLHEHGLIDKGVVLQVLKEVVAGLSAPYHAYRERTLPYFTQLSQADVGRLERYLQIFSPHPRVADIESPRIVDLLQKLKNLYEARIDGRDRSSVCRRVLEVAGKWKRALMGVLRY